VATTGLFPIVFAAAVVCGWGVGSFGGMQSALVIQVKKRSFLSHLCMKMPSFYQDRLGTNIGKALKNRLLYYRFLAVRAHGSEGQGGGIAVAGYRSGNASFCAIYV
jgi:hypothetical protein